MEKVIQGEKSHPSRVRGLKPLTLDEAREWAIAPFTGAWIETQSETITPASWSSHPSRVRGLKLAHREDQISTDLIAPFTGAWIETATSMQASRSACIAPFTGAWIETTDVQPAGTGVESHPSRVRGLKLHRRLVAQER